MQRAGSKKELANSVDKFKFQVNNPFENVINLSYRCFYCLWSINILHACYALLLAFQRSEGMVN